MNTGAFFESLEPRMLLSATVLSTDIEKPDVSLVQSSSIVVGSFTTPSQSNLYEVAVDEGDTLTIAISPADPSLRTSLTLSSDDVSPTTTAADIAGKPTILQTLITSGGLFTLDVSNITGTGQYTIQAIINAAIEEEHVGGELNNTIQAAQSLDDAVTPLPGTLGGERFAVVGQVSADNADIYRLSLTAGQSLSAAIEGINPNQLQIELLGPAGQSLAVGNRGATNVDAWLNGFVAPASGEYYLRVTGTVTENYTLVGAIDAHLAHETTNLSTQVIPPNTPTLGHLRDGAGQLVYVSDAPYIYEDDDQLNWANWVDFEESDIWRVHGAIGDNTSWSAVTWDPELDVDVIEFWLNEDQYFTADIDNTYGLDSVLRLFDEYGTEYEWSDDNPGPGEGSSTDSFLEFVAPEEGWYYIIVSSYDNFDYDPYVAGSGSSSYGYGTTGSYELILAIDGAASQPDTDTFDLLVAPGDALNITVEGTEPGMYLALELLDEESNIIASDYIVTSSGDPLIEYTVDGSVAAGTTYSVRVYSQTGIEAGYVLRATGATGAKAPTVTHFGLPILFPDEFPDYVSFPQYITAYLSDGVDPSSVDVSDLVITGPEGEILTASDVQFLGGNQIRFSILNANVGSGTYDFAIDTGALTTFNGEAIAGYMQEMSYREEGPRVISSTIMNDAVIQPGEFIHIVEFSEALKLYSSIYMNGLPFGDDAAAFSFSSQILDYRDVVLTNLLTGETANPTDFDYYTSPAVTIESIFADIEEGWYEIRYLATQPGVDELDTDNQHIAGLDGMPLDGSPSDTLPSGDGVPGDDFVVYFYVDRAENTPLPGLVSVGPDASQVFTHDPVRGSISEATDVDTFTLNMTSGQLLSLAIESLDAQLQTRVRIIDPFGSEVVNITATHPGEQVLVDAFNINLDGEYIIELTSIGDIGRYELQATINAVKQKAGNQSLENAQNINSSALDMGNNSDRMAVLGSVSGTSYSASQTINGIVFAPNVLTYNFEAGPDPLGPVTLQFQMDNNTSLWNANQYLEVTFEDVAGQDLFVFYDLTRSTTVTLSAEQWRELIADGVATIRVKPSAAVTGNASSFLTITVDYQTADEADYYKLSLENGQTLDVAATANNGNGGVAFTLLDENGVALAASALVGTSSDAALAGFIAPQDGEYYLKVVGTGQYTLIATRNGQYDLEAEDKTHLTTSALLGGLQAPQSEGRTLRVAHLDDTNPPGGANNDAARLINQLNDSTIFDFDAQLFTYATFSTLADWSQFDVIVTGGVHEMNTDKVFAARIRAFVENGGGFVLVGDAPWRLGSQPGQSRSVAVDIDAVSAIHLGSPRQTAPNTIDLADVAHPIIDGLEDFAPGYSLYATTRGADGKPGSVVLGTSGDLDTVVYRLLGDGGRSVYLTSAYEADHSQSNPLRSGSPDQLLEQAVAWAAAAGDRGDTYTIDLTAGQTVTIQTQTPAAVGEYINELDPLVQLIDPEGNIIAVDANSLDGRNGQLVYTVPVAGDGRYSIRVLAEGEAGGSYILSVNGAASTDTTAPIVINTAPYDGQRYAQPPTQFTLQFDEFIDLTTIDANDLVLTNGATVTGFEVIDGKTIRYMLDVPDEAGDYTFTLAAGAVADFSGNGNELATGTFTIDRVGPSIIAQTPGTQGAAPFNSMTLTFDEPLDSDTVSIQDVVSFTAPGGGSLLGAIASVTANGNEVTINFTNQYALGTYTLVFGPNVTDTVGLAMDQDGNGTQGEATDTYTATVSIQSPNLMVETISTDSTAQFGEQLELTYTVRNNGTDAATEGWIDRIYLSNDNVFNTGDLQLLAIPAGTNAPLSAGDSYTRTVTVNLPLNTSWTDGDFHIIVRTDATNTQPEDNEADNTNTAPINITVPPLPDLAITQITVAPSPQLSGQGMNVTWELSNLGDGDMTGTIYEDVYLSIDGELTYHDRYLGRFGFTGTIAAGDSVTRSQTIDIPVDVHGDYYLIIKTDSTSRVYEHLNENNNISITTEPITFEYPPLPDLVVSQITVPETALSNELITVTWTIHNNGSADFAGAFTDRILLSADDVIGGDLELGKFSYDGAIAAGQSITRSANVLLPPDLSGNRHIVVQTDFNNEVFENVGENNNYSISEEAVDVTRSPFPNLMVTLVTVPPIIFSGQSFDVTWRVTNMGDGPTSAANWRDNLFLSGNGVIDGQDINLGWKATPAYLNAGESYEQTMTVTVPNGVQGPRYVLVQTDSTNRVFELNNENDNVGVSAVIDAQLTPPPDLKVIHVDAPPAAFSGMAMTLRWTVRNDGEGATVRSQWSDRVWMSTDEVLDSSDYNLGHFSHEGVLQPGETYVAEVVVSLPVGESGPYYFFVDTDVFNQVFEFAFDGNNLSHDPVATEVFLTPPPDLVTTITDAPTYGEAGRNITVKYTVENEGSTNTPNNYWIDRVYLSADGTYDPAQDIVLGTHVRNSDLGVGEDYNSTFNVRLPDGISGTYTLFVVSDNYNHVFELDNTNNIARPAADLQVALTPPDLVVTELINPVLAVAGASIPLSFTVENQGIGATTVNSWTDGIYLSTDDVWSSFDTHLASATRKEALAAGDSYTLNFGSLHIPLTTTPGEYYLIVATDRSGNAYESNNNNNVFVQQITVVRDTADLEVTSIKPIASAQSGVPLEIEWTVTNKGGATTNATTWVDRVYLSTDPALGGAEDILIAQVQRTNPLAAGASYTQTHNALIPAGLTGNYYIIVETDYYNHVYEPGADNNNVTPADAPTLFTPAPAADLVIENVEAPELAYSGRFISVSYTTRNAGTAAIYGAVHESVYLSADRLFDSGDIHLGSPLEVVNLGVGESRTVTRTYKLPAGVTGSYYVLVRADASNRVVEGEAGELNNIGYKDSPMQIELAPPVDLVAGVITVPVTAEAGQNATITYSVTNSGPNPALGPWMDTLYISTDQTWDIEDRRFAEVIREAHVLPGDSYTATATAPLPGLVPGNYYVIVRSDILNNVVETDETNNASASLDAFALEIPTLALDTPTEVTIRRNRITYFQLDLPANQTFVLDVDSLGLNVAVELYARGGDVPARDRFDYAMQTPLEADARLVIPNTTDGKYYIGIYGASVPGAEATISINARLVPFSILDETYGPAGNAGNRTIQINGARFDRTIQATLIGAGDVEREATEMFAVHEARAYATFNLKGLSAGLYDVRITKSDGSTFVLEDAVQVVNGGGGTNNPRILAPSEVTLATQQVAMTAVWGNDGLNDSIAPLLYLESSNLIGDAGAERTASFMVFYGAGLDDGPAGILRPHQSSSRQLGGTVSVGSTGLLIDRLVDDWSQSYDWESLRPQLRRLGMDEEMYNAAFDQMVARNGDTWGDYLTMLSRNATLMPRELADNRDPNRLAELELQFAAADLGNGVVGKLFAADFAVDISHVKVILSDVNTGNGYSVRTLNDGTFIFFNIDAGEYEFNAEGARLIDSPPVHVTVNDGQTVRDVLLNAEPGVATATGRVLDAENGDPIPHTFIRLYDGDTPVFMTATDEAGQYDLSLAPDGVYSLWVQPEGYGRTIIDNFEIGHGIETPDIMVGRGQTATGQVVFNDTASGAFMGADLVILAAPDLSNTSYDYFTVSNDPTFVFNGLAPGTYTFWFSSGTAAKQIDNVVIDGSGIVDLGIIELEADLPDDSPADTPTQNTTAQAVGDDAAAPTGKFTSLIKAESVYPNTGQALYQHGQITGAALDRVEDYLVNDWLTFAKTTWGNQNATFWLTYIESSPQSPPARNTYYQNSEIVNGAAAASGFKDEPLLDTYFGLVNNIANRYFQDAFDKGTYTVEQVKANEFMVVTLETFAGWEDNFDYTTIQGYGYSGVFNIPGNLAGGAMVNYTGDDLGPGMGGGTGQVYTDIREIAGYAIMEAVSDTTVRIRYTMDYYAADTVDFYPGDPGTWYEQLVTRRLMYMERYGDAFDVPFIVNYDIDWDDLYITKQPRNPQSPDDDPDFTMTIVRRRSGDPNDIIGPDGFGPEKFVSNQLPLDYTIRFENDPNLADAPAQEIIITQVLDSDIDARTFILGDIQISDLFVDVPDNRSFYQTRVDMTETWGIYVDVYAGINIETSEAFWQFVSIDPATGELPFDPFMGLLPVNDDNGIGEGFVQYSVKTKAGVATGDVIDAEATIVFDVNGPIDTPAIFNTLDVTAPTSAVDALPATSTSETFDVTWSGLDEANGSGIASYDIYVSVDAGPFTLWLEQTTLTTAQFVGEAGKSYAFYAVARDNAGNEEEAPVVADAVTNISAGPTITGYQINDGSAQRSRVKSLTIFFDSPVNVGAIAFELTRRDNGAVIPYSISLSGDRMSAILTFTGHSLDDGIYDLRVMTGSFTNDNGQPLTTEGLFSFHRLYGDMDGDGDTDSVDLLRFRTALNSQLGDPNYDPDLDFNGDGVIDRNDYDAARQRSRIKLIP